MSLSSFDMSGLLVASVDLYLRAYQSGDAGDQLVALTSVVLAAEELLDRAGMMNPAHGEFTLDDARALIADARASAFVTVPSCE